MEKEHVLLHKSTYDDMKLKVQGYQEMKDRLVDSSIASFWIDGDRIKILAGDETVEELTKKLEKEIKYKNEYESDLSNERRKHNETYKEWLSTRSDLKKSKKTEMRANIFVAVISLVVLSFHLWYIL